jgi:hypothetical protein
MLGRNKNSESGQSTVEFALTMILVSSFMFLFFQLSMVMGMSSYIQYATFMAARAYLSAGPDTQDQQTRARTVIQQMLKAPGNSAKDRLPTIVKGEGGSDGTVPGLSFDAAQFDPKSRNYSWLQGIRYSFKGRVFLMPIGTGGATKPGAATLSLTSESFLGRETTTEECRSEMKNRGDGIYDNGC